jgi:hypothetical protein
LKLEGSCHCGAVRFRLETNTPFPYQHCYCSICRKTQGGSGSAVNIMGWADSLEVEGAENITVYHANIDGAESDVERRFCGKCGSALWVYHDKWPELIHPFASAIDTELPRPDEVVHMMLEFKAPWIEVPAGKGHVHFDDYPDRSIEVWHEKQGLKSR